MSEPFVKREMNGRIATLTFNRRDPSSKLPFLSEPGIFALGAHLSDADWNG
jgi:hypothetical protein